jgi:predicted ATPase
MALSAGTRLGPYEILSALGAGGMGEVYKAHDTKLDRSVAIKLLPAHLAGDAERLRRFHAEARAASALNHPHILVIHDFDDVDGRPCMVTEFVEGQTLRQRLESGSITIREAVDIATQAASALGAAHARGIVHRDLKPENVMVRPDGYVKVLDFGLAKLIESDLNVSSGSADMTRLGMVVGTPRYMSPEQARGLPVDRRTDIFSLGTVLYEMVTGSSPFDAPDTMALPLAIVNEAPAPLSAAVQSCAPGLGEVLRRALAKDRERRYSQISELLNDLKKIQLALEIGLHASGPRERGREHPTGVIGVPPSAWPNTLPVPPTPIVGRQTELAAIAHLFQTDEARLVVLTGPGGAGKTRVALEAAARLADRFDDGVWFVPLASLQDPALVSAAIAQTLGLKETADADSMAVLERHLCPRHLLLVLDNFEHVVAAASVITHLLSACPRVRVLVTSRAVLRVRSEHEVAVPPLRLPEAGRSLSLADLQQVEAVALFVDRARAARPEFAITRDNAAAIVEICARLDGLPLALELAAARIRLLTPADLLARLARRLPLLTAGPRDLPARQQTLRAAIGWSYQLLTSDEQRVFARLAVFLGGFTLEAAEAICGGDDVPVLDAVDALAGSSLLRRREALDGSSRFDWLQTVGEFADERLAASQDADVLRRRHAGFFLSLAEAAAAAADFDRLEAEHDNLRAAIDWTIGAGDTSFALRFGAAMWRFWERRGFMREAADRLDRILRMPAGGSPDRLRSSVAYAAGVLADAAGRYEVARARFKENLTAARAAGDEIGVANSLNNLGIVSLRHEDYDTARRSFTESLSLWRAIGHRHAVTLSLNNLGNVANLQADHETAWSLHQQSLGMFRDLGDERGVAQTLGHLADVRRDQHAHEDARALYGEAFAIYQRIGDQSGMASCFIDLGHVSRESGQLDGARAMYQEAAVIFGELGDARGIARVLESVVDIALAEQKWERAFTLAGAAAALRQSSGAPLPPGERARFEARLAAVDHPLEDRRQWFTEGQRTAVERAITLALDT